MKESGINNKWVLPVLALLIFNTGLLAQTDVARQLKSLMQQHITNINKRSADKSKILPAFEGLTASGNAEVDVFAGFVVALCRANPRDGFAAANEQLSKLIPLINKMPVEQRKNVVNEFFRLEGAGLDIQNLTRLNDMMLQNIEEAKNEKLINGLSLYFYQLAQIFYLFSEPTEKCGMLPCLNDFYYSLSFNNALINKYFYNSYPVVKDHSDQIKLWYIDIFKHVPEK